MIYYSVYESPLGKMFITESNEKITGIYFEGQKHFPKAINEWNLSLTTQIKKAISQLQEYFNGERREFQLPLKPEGTAFQYQVWEQIAKVQHGETIQYGEIAKNIGKPNSSRAVGSATGKNPISVIIPCHRVLGKSGKMTGYAGGLNRKEALLQLENKEIPP